MWSIFYVSWFFSQLYLKFQLHTIPIKDYYYSKCIYWLLLPEIILILNSKSYFIFLDSNRKWIIYFFTISICHFKIKIDNQKCYWPNDVSLISILCQIDEGKFVYSLLTKCQAGLMTYSYCLLNKHAWYTFLQPAVFL